MENFGTFLKQTREKRGLTVQELATLCSLTPRNISKVEDSLVTPRDMTVAKLAKFFHFDLEEALKATGYLHDNTSELARLLMLARLKKGLSKTELAKKCDLSVSKLCDIELSKNIRPFLDTLEKLAVALDLDASLLREVTGYKLSFGPGIASAVKNARLEANLSQFKAALACDVTQATWSEIEAGLVKRPSQKVLTKISLGLQVTLPSLLLAAGYSTV